MGSLDNAQQGGWRLKSGPARALRQSIRQNRRAAPLRFLASVCEKYLRAYYNEGFYEFESNGESFALRQFARWSGDRPVIVWDVGANAGEWAELAKDAVPSAMVHSFEILPPIADAYAERLKGVSWSQLHRLGLSDEPGEVQVTWNQDCDSTSSIAIRTIGVPGGHYEQMVCPVSTADSMIEAGLPPPHLLKIDTEGHDAAVLRGARRLLSSTDAPAMIQFEYGETWIPGRETLEGTQRLLEDAGYLVGRCYPEHVDFKRYTYADDHFRMGNMIAARPPELIALLAG